MQQLRQELVVTRDHIASLEHRLEQMSGTVEFFGRWLNPVTATLDKYNRLLEFLMELFGPLITSPSWAVRHAHVTADTPVTANGQDLQHTMARGTMRGAIMPARTTPESWTGPRVVQPRKNQSPQPQQEPVVPVLRKTMITGADTPISPDAFLV